MFTSLLSGPANSCSLENFNVWFSEWTIKRNENLKKLETSAGIWQRAFMAYCNILLFWLYAVLFYTLISKLLYVFMTLWFIFQILTNWTLLYFIGFVPFFFKDTTAEERNRPFW